VWADESCKERSSTIPLAGVLQASQGVLNAFSVGRHGLVALADIQGTSSCDFHMGNPD
jgi:hypothetical protein